MCDGMAVVVCSQGPPAAAHHHAGEQETRVDLRGGSAGEPGPASDTAALPQLGEHNLLGHRRSHAVTSRVRITFTTSIVHKSKVLKAWFLNSHIAATIQDKVNKDK